LITNRFSNRSVFVIASVLTLGACQVTQDATGSCTIEGPAELMPQKIKQVRLGMLQSELKRLLGPADYSPTDGVFYFSTGGDCPIEEGERSAPCGLVVEFRDYNQDKVTETVQSCWWGAIGE
jgi:hypothetical protein